MLIKMINIFKIVTINQQKKMFTGNNNNNNNTEFSDLSSLCAPGCYEVICML